MNKKYLKEKMALVNEGRFGRNKKIIDSSIVFKTGFVQNRMGFNSIDDVYREIILVVNELIEGNEFIKSIKSLNYSNYYNKRQAYILDLERLTINGEVIPVEQIIKNKKLIYSKLNTESYLWSFPLFK